MRSRIPVQYQYIFYTESYRKKVYKCEDYSFKKRSPAQGIHKLYTMSASATLLGLSNLVEAATALAKLTCCAPTPAFAQIHHHSSHNHDGGKVTKNHRSAASSFAADGVKEIFPERLMAMLNDESLADIVTWLPHGRSFQIIRPDIFTEHVLPKFVPPVDVRSSTKYPSFTRKLNRW